MTPAGPPLILGNWKMSLTGTEAAAFVRSLLPHLRGTNDREVALAPPFTSLAAVGPLLRGSPIRLAAQDLFWEDEGPFTGEISGLMLEDAGVTYVLVAHSERRRHLEETDRTANLKMRAALRCGLKPILCIGEDEAERAAGLAETVVRSQLARALAGIEPGSASRLQIAYEPVWAIGTGKAASLPQAAEMHALIRHELRALYGTSADGVRVLYGGSVTPANADALMSTDGIGGVLVGGASLSAEDFARIVAFRPVR